MFSFHSRRAYLCAKCKKLYNTVLLYDEHLDFCDGLNEDFDFDIITGNNEIITGGGGGDGDTDLSASGDNMMIKTEHQDLDELLLQPEVHSEVLDDDPLMLVHEAEYLDE